MRIFYTIIMFLSLSSFLSISKAEEPDWNDYEQLLEKYVKQGELNNVNLMTVDYLGLKADKNYQRVVSQIATFDISKLQTQQERLAFYINAYNILAIKVVLDHWPVKSIKDVGGLFTSVWKEDAGKVNGKTVTLHYIEHEVLRKMAEPRIHMAIVCASVSCPDLRNEAYTAAKLDQQLSEQSQLFLMNDKKGLHIKGNTAHVSKIFDWFEEDFERVGGTKSFIQQYNKDFSPRMSVDASLNYDWQLNKSH